MSQAPKSKGAVLFQLLKEVDSERLEVMLDPRVLLHLLTVHRHDADVAEAPEEVAQPGLLLLALLHEHGADALWASIPDELRGYAEANVKARIEANETPVERAGTLPLVLGIGGATLPTMVALGHIPGWPSGVSLGGVAFALAGCGAVGAWWYPADRWAAGAGCAAGGAVSVVTGGLIASSMAPYPRMGAVLALFVGALAAALVVRLLHRSPDATPRSF